jgi:hypothetical protein
LDDIDRELLKSPFSKKEVKLAIDGMKTNSSPSKNSFTVLFFKKHWQFNMGELLKLVVDFNNNEVDLRRLNYGVITLVPKSKKQTALDNTDLSTY